MTTAIEPATSNKLADQVARAIKEPTLVDALAYIALWENERIVQQAHKNLTSGHRYADGRMWDTCFKICLQAVMDAWELKVLMEDKADLVVHGFD